MKGYINELAYREVRAIDKAGVVLGMVITRAKDGSGLRTSKQARKKLRETFGDEIRFQYVNVWNFDEAA